MHILFQGVAAYALVCLPCTPATQVSSRHLLPKVSELTESHCVMVLPCVLPTLMMS